MSTSLRVLVVEDQLDDYELLMNELHRAGFDAIGERVDTAEKFVANLDRGLDVILSDFTMPRFSGLDALRLMKRSQIDVPFIFVSGTIGEEVAVVAMQEGAADYLIKDRLGRLGPAIKKAIALWQLKAEKFLADQTAARLAAIVESSSDAIIATTLDGVIVTWNMAAERLYGYPAAEIVGKDMSLLVPSGRRQNDVPEDHHNMAARLRSGQIVEAYETVRVRKNGRRVDVSVSISPILDAGGAVLGASFIAQDISQRRRAERFLAAEHAVTRILANSQTLEEASSHLLRALGDGLRWEAAVLWKVDCAENVLRRVKTWHAPWAAANFVNYVNYLDQLAVLEPDAGIAGRSWVLGEPIWQPYSVPAADEQASESRPRAVICIPMKLGNQMLGAIEFYNPELRHPDAPMLAALTNIASQISQFSERRKSESALRASEERHRTLIDATAAIIWATTASGAFDAEQPAWSAFTGQTLDQYQGLGWLNVVHPDEREKSARAWATALTERSNYQLEHRLRRADGEYRQMSVRAVPIRDLGGAVREWVGVHSDVTDQRRSELERAELLTQLTVQIKRMPLAYILNGPDLRFIGWNPAAENMFGFTKAEILGKHPFEMIVPPQSEAMVANIFDRLMAGDMNAHGTSANVKKDGTTIFCEWHNTPLFGPDGVFQGILSLAQDVTARRRAEQALNMRDRAILAATQGLLITDPNLPGNPIVYVSPGFERITGYTADEVLGRNCRFLQGEETDPSVVACLRAAIQAEQSCTVEVQNFRKDGSAFWNELSISPVRDGDGRLTHFVGVQTDITTRRQMEEQFRQVQKMDAFGQLAGGVAHDFNNLLTIINGYSELLLQNLPQGDPSRKLIAEIHRAGERSAGLTQQLLAFSRQQVLALRILNLNEVITDTDNMLRRLIGEDVVLATTLASEPWAIRADRGQIEQVLLNLVVNARDAMPKGGRLTIETLNVELDETYVNAHVDARPGPHVLLSVTDTGCGMIPEMIAKIFEPFYTTKAPGKGTGLGLATVYGIVTQSGGHVGVLSEVGVGTTFAVYLPCVETPSDDSMPRSRDMTSPSGTETVLLAEDEDGVRVLTNFVLTDCGYNVLEATDGDDAIRVVEEHDGPIHLLITDVVMPGSGGRVVAEEMAKRYPGIRVLFVSGYTDDAVIRHGVLRDGMNFLQKPFSPGALALKVREVLDKVGEA